MKHFNSMAYEGGWYPSIFCTQKSCLLLYLNKRSRQDIAKENVIEGVRKQHGEGHGRVITNDHCLSWRDAKRKDRHLLVITCPGEGWVSSDVALRLKVIYRNFRDVISSVRTLVLAFDRQFFLINSTRVIGENWIARVEHAQYCQIFGRIKYSKTFPSQRKRYQNIFDYVYL